MKGYEYLSVILTASVFLCCGCAGPIQVEVGGVSQEAGLFASDWTERLPEWESQLGAFDGKLDLKEDEWLAVKADHYYDMGASGTFLIRDKGEVRFLQDKIIDQTGIISASEPQVMEGWNAEGQPIWGGTAKEEGYFYGVYRLNDEKWMLEPKYEYIDNSDPDFHYSISAGVDDKTKDCYSFYDSEWKLLWSKELSESSVYEVGDYIWIMDLSGVWDGVRSLTTAIYDKKGELVRTLETPSLITSANGSYNGWFGEGKIMCIRGGQDDSWQLYDSAGSLLFESSQISDSVRGQICGDSGNAADAGDSGDSGDAVDVADSGDAADLGDAVDVADSGDAVDLGDAGDVAGSGIKVTGCLQDGRLAVLKWGGSDYLYDVETQELLSGPEDTLEFNHNSNVRTPQAVAVVSPDGGRRIYRYDRTSPETSQGLPYLYLAQGDGEDDRQYYYRIDHGAVTLGDGEDMEYTYQGSFDENTQILPYKGKIVQLCGGGDRDADTHVYLGEELVMSGTELETSDHGNYCIENKKTGEKISMDENGNYYKGDIDQSVLAMGTDYRVTMEEDTLFSVMDKEGRPVLWLPGNYKYPEGGSHGGF